jgi:predicted RNA polymerase sigma factor
VGFQDPRCPYGFDRDPPADEHPGDVGSEREPGRAHPRSAFRAESGPVLATLIRVLGDFQLAEDALQDAFTAALETWPNDGLPASPRAWLATAARRKALDRLRHLRIVEAKGSELALSIRLEQEVYGPQDELEVSPVPDDRGEGDLVLLGEQDRTKWKRPQIEEGARLDEEALRMRRPGPYQVQGAIAAVRAEALTAADTDWRQIVVLYDQLLRYEQSPVIELNRSVALSFAVGPVEALELLDGIERAGKLREYAPFHLARADILRRLRRDDEAGEAYRRALPLTQNEQVRRFIEQRLHDDAN